MLDINNAITEAEAITAAKNNALKSMRIAKRGESFIVHMRLTWRKEELFLCTTRNRTEPREFKHIGRLVEYIQANFPTIHNLELLLD